MISKTTGKDAEGLTRDQLISALVAIGKLKAAAAPTDPQAPPPAPLAG
jgi:hypothetical protein